MSGGLVLFRCRKREHDALRLREHWAAHQREATLKEAEFRRAHVAQAKSCCLAAEEYRGRLVT